MNEYIKQAKDFLAKTNSTLEIEYRKNDYHFNDDTHKRNIFKITLTKWPRNYSFNFGDSIMNTNKFEPKTYLQKALLKWTLKTLNRQNYTLQELNQINSFKEKINPNEYDILACLNVDYCETLQEFCDCYGYEIDSINANNTYKAVMKQQDGLLKLYSDDEIELLNEIN